MTEDQSQKKSLNPQQRVAVLVHWMKGLSSIPGNAIDGAEWAGRVAGHDGDQELAPAWVSAWEEADMPLHGIKPPPAPSVGKAAQSQEDDDTPEVKALTALMDPLDTKLREGGQITDQESDTLLECLWALHDWNHDKAMAFLILLDRIAHKGTGARKNAKPSPLNPGGQP
jgi:hypothetical protein